ncbi:Biopolymer transport protein exbD1 [Pararobbsia alpina]|uniref:ExbD/TolR family protein n=1 Tax=Pararobbsia alpina TaxID=621374 RepID=UPI0039A48B45
MAFGGFGDGEQGGTTRGPMSDINMTPLIDVMLVLLVIFIITAPLLTRAVKLDLPRASAVAAPDSTRTVDVSIDAKGQIYWDAAPLDEAGLRAKLASAGKQNPVPEVHLRADRATRYETIARVMADAQQAGVSRIGFVTLPDQANTGASSATPAATGN